MNERQKLLLEYLIEEYAKSGRPVSSGNLASKKKLKASSATLRIEMSRLARKGYLKKLYFSSGKVPTVKAYRFYLENYCFPRISPAQERKLVEVFKAEDIEEILKGLIFQISEISKTLAFLFWRDFFFLQGLKYLLESFAPFEKREIAKTAVAIEKGIEFVRKIKERDLKVYLGEELPFSKTENLSLIVTGIPQGNLGIIGSLGINYSLIIGLLQKTKKLLEETFWKIWNKKTRTLTMK